MENATKALLIAGGVLIGIIILAALIYAYTSFTRVAAENEQAKATEQLAEFNKPYTSYEGKILRGAEVISVVNRAVSDNRKLLNNEKINVFLKIEYTQKPGVARLGWNSRWIE